MIITKSFEILLYPMEMSFYKINAMCGEINDKGPHKGVFYQYVAYQALTLLILLKLLKQITDRIT